MSTQIRDTYRTQLQRYQDEKKIREQNRIERKKKAGYRKAMKQNIRRGIALGVILVLVFFVVEFVLPGSILKKKKVIDDTPIEDRFEDIPEKKEGSGLTQTEAQILWSLLSDHFDGNKTAVLGVMCNLNAESQLMAGNLEDYNNELWGIDDDEYTQGVNRRTIDKRDFLESRNGNDTNGYYNDYDQWVNIDGGYGYAQYTAYENKEELYRFAEKWFSPGGEGEDQKFDIADPNMQAHYIIYLLGTDQYADMDSAIRNAQTVADACYIWLKDYEKPYDPYSDNYYTLAFDRAAAADAIEQAVKEGEPEEKNESTQEETTTEEW